MPESILRALVAEMADNPADIQKIVADDNKTFHFHLSEVSVGIRVWEYLSLRGANPDCRKSRRTGI